MWEASSPWRFAAGLALAVLALAVLPPYFKRRTYQYTASDVSTASVDKFPLDWTLVEYPSGRKTTIAALVSQQKRGVLVNFWATWCPPCLEELPSLQRLDLQLRSAKQEALPRLVTVSVDDGQREIASLFANLPFRPSFTVLHDPKGALANSVGSKRFPETYWVAADGRVLHKWLGPQDWLSEPVLSVLARPHQP